MEARLAIGYLANKTVTHSAHGAMDLCSVYLKTCRDRQN